MSAECTIKAGMSCREMNIEKRLGPDVPST